MFRTYGPRLGMILLLAIANVLWIKIVYSCLSLTRDQIRCGQVESFSVAPKGESPKEVTEDLSAHSAGCILSQPFPHDDRVTAVCISRESSFHVCAGPQRSASAAISQQVGRPIPFLGHSRGAFRTVFCIPSRANRI